MVARLGGDEFVILARGADERPAPGWPSRVTDAVDALSVGTRDGAITLSASVGVATASSGARPRSLLAEADEAMYAVKGSSPHRADPPVAQASTTTGMIIGRRRCLLVTQRPTTRRIVCCSW